MNLYGLAYYYRSDTANKEDKSSPPNQQIKDNPLGECFIP